MQYRIPVALAALAMAASVGTARADLNINGAVGLPLNPTAQIPAENGVRIQGNYFDHGSYVHPTLGNTDVKSYGIYGATRVSDRIEVSGGFSKFETDPDNNLDRSGVALGAKYLFTRESDPAGVRLAAGVGYDRALGKNTHVYGVASKYLGNFLGGSTQVTGHLGLRYDRFSEAGNSKKTSIFAGVEVPVTATGDLQLVGELGSKNIDASGAKVPYSASVRYRPQGQPFGASIGVARQGLTGDSGLFVQLGYTFTR